MQNLRRNERAFWYAVYQGREIVADADGNPCGVKVLHGNPVKAMGNISPANGQITQYQFGEHADYDRTIIMTGTDWPIDTSSVLWVETPPDIKDGGSTDTPHDYRVACVAKSLNSTAIAIKRVNVSGA